MAQAPWSEGFEKILRVHCRLADTEGPLNPELTFDLLGVDSIELLRLIFDIEEVFGVEFPNDMLTGEVLATPATFWVALQELTTNGRNGI
jgi:acyl carrier protein